MSKQYVFLRYQFLFDTAELWSNLSQFESALADFFREHDCEARIIKTVEGQIGERIMHLEKKEMAPKAKGLSSGKKVVTPKDKKQGIKKGGKPLPKVPDKKRGFSTKKGRRLPQKKRFKATLGGR